TTSGRSPAPPTSPADPVGFSLRTTSAEPQSTRTGSGVLQKPGLALSLGAVAAGVRSGGKATPGRGPHAQPPPGRSRAAAAWGTTIHTTIDVTLAGGFVLTRCGGSPCYPAGSWIITGSARRD